MEGEKTLAETSHAPHIQMLTVGALATNCYLLADPDSRQAVVIDPGDEADRILATLRDGDWEVSAVLLTHAHFDHLLAARQVIAELQVPFLVPPGELVVLRRAPDAVNLWMGYEIEAPPEPDGPVGEGDVVEVGPFRYDVISTPGHSPDAVCLVGEKEVFVGDTLFAGSIGRTDLPGADYETLMRSIEEKLLPLDDEIVVYPGHGPATTIGRERASNPFILDWIT
jgi:glyoxylase-like metal-dependent hydrolase (beta-lactamase superfamily II)